MSDNDSKPSRMNSRPAHPGVSDDESWKTRPSGETTSDEGHNAEVERERKVAENAPLLPRRRGRPR